MAMFEAAASKEFPSAQLEPRPMLHIRRSDAGDAICVAAKWPDGRIEDICGFASETDANDWIANKFQDWVEARARAA